MKKIVAAIKDKLDLEDFFRDNKEIIMKVAVIAIATIAAFFVFVYGDDSSETLVIEDETENSETMEKNIYVDIGGEVRNPTVAALPEGSRVDDAIESAGGVTEKADLKDINRAAFLEDGEKIYIPEIVEEDGFSAIGETAGSSYSDDKININIANSEELQELTGVGPVTAQKIIDYRTQNGRFSSIEDIKNVSGIGDKTFEKMKEDIKI